MLYIGLLACVEPRVCDCYISRHGLCRNFEVYHKRAGPGKWKDALKVLRRNCETDWAQEYPQYAVSIWMGHDIEVSGRHYLQVPAGLYRKVDVTKEAENRGKNQHESYESGGTKREWVSQVLNQNAFKVTGV